MRVAFPLIHSASWTGGYNYLLNLFRSVRKYQTDQITPVLFCGEDALENDLQPFREIAGLEIVRSSVFDANNARPRLMCALLFGLDSGALDLFRRNGIDVVFENATFFGWRIPIPVIAWMPDFQHRLLREQFGFAAYWRREAGFRAQVASGRVIMLSSEDARKDCEHYYPDAVGRTEVVRFAAPVPDELIEKEPETVVREYNLPDRFFYLPNQFWKHKNHIVVIEALGLLKRQGCKIAVAVTGNPRDPRHPEYFEQLNARIRSLGLQEDFRILGLVPRSHVISLMRLCIALVNPSRFEGWSSTVEEARTLGVPMILSDIGVHREQMGEGAVYFDPDNASVLAEKLRAACVDTNPAAAARLRVEGDDNVIRFARDFVAVANRAMARVTEPGRAADSSGKA
ncbi:MAG: glycosyltransferase family 1 protein [Gallionella sp.]